MATTSPLTGAPIPEPGDDIDELLEVDDAVMHLEQYVAQRYTNAAARDSALPVPARGMVAVVGSTAANSYPCWHDGTNWRGLVIEQPAVDAGFPVAASGVTTETTISRITVPARDYARTVTAVGTSYTSYSQANDVDLLIYAGATLVSRARTRMAVSVGMSWSANTSPIAVAAGASLVLDLRVNRAAGTGAVTTSTGVSVTFSAMVTPV